jgi:hypothetical protein
MATFCCAELQACAADEDCACFTACVDGGKNEKQCASQCQFDPEENGAVVDLGVCGVNSCDVECG